MINKKVLNIIKYSLIVCVAVAFIIYALHLFGVFSDNIKFESVYEATNENSVNSKAILFADETVLYAEHGAVFPLYKNGELVQVGKDVVQVYEKEEEKRQGELFELKQKLSDLEKASNVYSDGQTSEIDAQISELYNSYLSLCEKNELDKANKIKNDLLILLSRRDIITNKKLNYSEEISSLEFKISELSKDAKAPKETVISPVGGYYFSRVDGYENAFNSKKLENITYEEYFALTENKVPDTFKSDKLQTAGKILTSQKWYIGCTVDKTELGGFTENESFDSVFDNLSEEKLTLTLYKILSLPSEDKVVLLFSCSEVNENIDFKRFDNVKIIKNEIRGIKIPSSAIFHENGQKGVYVLKDGVLKFTSVNVIYEEEDYVLSDGGVSPYDKVAVSGKNLYDGKIVN